MGRRAAATALLLTGFPALVACRATSRPLEDGRAAAASSDAALIAGMNPYILAEDLDLRVQVEVDWVDGGEPSPGALAHLEGLLRRYCPAGRTIDLALDDRIPQAELEGLRGLRGLESLVSRHLDADPSAGGHELIYVLYVPRSEPFFGERLSGLQESLEVERDGGTVSVRSILIFYEEIERDALLWITAAKVERAMLAHELGHLLGLVSNPEHVQRGHPHHCNEPGCVLHSPNVGSSLYNAPAAFLTGRIPDGFCARCRADIVRAKELWRDRARVDPDFAARLGRERHAPEYEARRIDF